jgi:ATP-dependent RNA helicase DDX18/HAS1
LTPNELGFLKYLRQAKVTVQEFEFPAKKVPNISSQIENLISKNYFLNRSARDAYRSYLLAYASHSHKDIFDVLNVDLAGAAKSFGLSEAPLVHLPVRVTSSSRDRKRSRASSGGGLGGGGGDVKEDNDPVASRLAARNSGVAFSASNPYGRRDVQDTRQFMY